MMENRYSIAIYPPVAVMDLVKGMKHQLAASIGWFNSKNSNAHVTICEFNAFDKEIASIRNLLSRRCFSASPVNLYFNYIGHYNYSTVFIAPDNTSKITLMNLMKRFQRELPVRNLYKSSDPHMSIARKLNEQKFTMASDLFKQVEINFCCDRIVLRVLDLHIKQFVVIDEFLFQNNPIPLEEQLTLF